MFPIEVGTWEASIRPWREQYGREMRGVGGMNSDSESPRTSLDRIAAHAACAIERLKPLVELGGYIRARSVRIIACRRRPGGRTCNTTVSACAASLARGYAQTTA